MEIGAIFDWDGVVIDSSSHHEESWERLAKEEGKILPVDHFKKGFGMKNEKIIPGFLAWTSDRDEILRMSLRKEELYREVVEERGVAPLPGIVDFLEMLYQAKIPCVVGSSTHRLNIETILDVMGVTKYFPLIVSAEDVSHGKPDPEVFTVAASKIGVEPQNCIVFEDAQVGIDAGLAGGMKVIALSTTHPAEELSGAARIVSRLDVLSMEDLLFILTSS